MHFNTMLSVDKSRGVNFSSMYMYVDSARSSSTLRKVRTVSLALPLYLRTYVTTHTIARVSCVLAACCRLRFTKPARAFTDGKLADGQGGRSTAAACIQWVTKIRAVFKWAFTSFKVVASSSKVG